MSKGVRSFARGAQLAVLGASSLALMGQSAWAQEGARDREDPITVTGVRGELESPRYTAPLLDTPQTITVISEEVIGQQNLLNLREILATSLPGVTFSAGEGGGGYGDGINLRGYSATDNIGIDGVRDTAQYTRTDPFNLEQVEVTSGANSVYSGVGAVGGSINLVSKRPRGVDAAALSAGIGTDNYARVTADVEQMLTPSVGGRLNVMMHSNDAPGRDVEEYGRWGIAPSVTFGFGSPTRVTLAAVHQEDDNIPEYGVPFALGPFNDGPLPGSDPSNYYGYSNVDRQEITTDMVTAIIEHDFSPTMSLRNLTRYAQIDQFLVVNPPQGTWCVDSGINPWTGAACPAEVAPGFYQPSGPRGTTRDTANQVLVNQTDLTMRFDTGGISHTMVAGLSVSQEDYERTNGNSLRDATGASPGTLPQMEIANPVTYYSGPVNYIATSAGDGEISNQAIYLFERAEIGPHWELNGGIRFERNEGSFRSGSIASPGAPIVWSPETGNEEDLLSYRLGIVYKPVESASIYFAYGNSETPSQSVADGACNETATSRTGANCNVDPEEAVSYELGGKWETFNRRLLLTAAIFRNERTNFRVNSGDATIPEQQLDGESRVDGLALGALGRITDRWSISANYTFLDSEVVQSISDIAIGGGAIDIDAGDPLPNTPEHAFSLWTTYDFGRLMIGYGANYQGDYTFGRASDGMLYYTDDYWVHRAMASYELSEHLDLQLNVNNLLDEEYFERIRNNSSNGWATPGPGRQAVVSINYQF